jgi:hypothetical protein
MTPTFLSDILIELAFVIVKYFWPGPHQIFPAFP